MESGHARIAADRLRQPRHAGRCEHGRAEESFGEQACGERRDAGFYQIAQSICKDWQMERDRKRAALSERRVTCAD